MSEFTPLTPFLVADAVTLRFGGTFDALVVCGSGLGRLPEFLELEGSAPMAELGLPVSTVPGHAAMLHVARTSAGRRVLVAAGRVHLYEGRSAAEVTCLVRASALLGASVLVVSNAAGSLHDDWGPGSLVLLSDQINLTGANPLTGPEPEPFGRSRFQDLSAIFDAELMAVARGLDAELREGVYAALAGPSYETPAEIRMLRAVGADLVGMSTVLETIAARHSGMRVLGISLVTNFAAGLGGLLDHAEVTAAGAAASERFSLLVRGVLETL
jgi:inosine/guanosine/xanthosine phosphorylase family protein